VAISGKVGDNARFDFLRGEREECLKKLWVLTNWLRREGGEEDFNDFLKEVLKVFSCIKGLSTMLNI